MGHKKPSIFYSEDYMGIRRLQVQRLAAECSLTSLLGKLSPTPPVSSVGDNRQTVAMASSGKVQLVEKQTRFLNSRTIRCSSKSTSLSDQTPRTSIDICYHLPIIVLLRKLRDSNTRDHPDT